MTQAIQDLIVHYFMIGTGLTLVLDLFIRFTKSSEPSTAMEVVAGIVLWPVMLCAFIINIIKRINNVQR
jgi:hypothetical protein